MNKLIRPLNNEEDAAVALLERFLKMAKQGQIDSVAIVVTEPGKPGYNGTACGSRIADLVLGLLGLQRKFLDYVESPDARPKSNIVRAMQQ